MKMTKILLLFFSCLILSGCKTEPSDPAEGLYWVYVSSSSSEETNAGIGTYQWNSKAGQLTHVGKIDRVRSSSYLSVDAERKRLYSIDQDGIFAFSINPTDGSLKFLNRREVNREGPCYISIARNGKFLMVAYYVSGEIATYPINEDGSVGDEISVVLHEGSSITERQESAHPHMIVSDPKGDLIMVADLGTDKVYTYSLSDRGVLSNQAVSITELPAGFGPRHIAFHPSRPFIYVLGELTAEVMGFEYNSGTGLLTPVNKVGMLPDSVTVFNKSADIHISGDGNHLYASNRGYNSLTVYDIDSDNGALSLNEIVSCGGDWPRAFEIDPSDGYVLVANKRSDNIAVFSRDETTGKLTNSMSLESVPFPQCIKFILKE